MNTLKFIYRGLVESAAILTGLLIARMIFGPFKIESDVDVELPPLALYSTDGELIGRIALDTTQETK